MDPSQPLPAEPPDFWYDFATSAGLGGLLTLIGATIAAGAAFYATKRSTKQHKDELAQRNAHHTALLDAEKDKRRDEQRASEIARCWDRLVWLVQATATSADAAAPGISFHPDMAYELAGQIERDAMRLQDETIQIAVFAYSIQLGRAHGEAD